MSTLLICLAIYVLGIALTFFVVFGTHELDRGLLVFSLLAWPIIWPLALFLYGRDKWIEYQDEKRAARIAAAAIAKAKASRQESSK